MVQIQPTHEHGPILETHQRKLVGFLTLHKVSVASGQSRASQPSEVTSSRITCHPIDTTTRHRIVDPTLPRFGTDFIDTAAPIAQPSNWTCTDGTSNLHIQRR